MKIPFVSFLPMERELDKDLRNAFERVYTSSWYIGGVEDENFEKAFAEYCHTDCHIITSYSRIQVFLEHA